MLDVAIVIVAIVYSWAAGWKWLSSILAGLVVVWLIESWWLDRKYSRKPIDRE